jgi:hypothetical protein
VQALLIEQNKRRPWWRRLFAASVMLVAMTAASAGAKADFRDGNELYAECTGDNSKQLICIGYVMAIADAARAPNAVGASGFTVCELDDVTVKQMFGVVTQYLSAHSEKRPHAAFSLVAAALAEAFPCSH